MEDFDELFRKRIVVYKEPSGVRRIRNLVYNTDQGVDYSCDFYLPEGLQDDKEGLPVAILVHGEAPAGDLKEAGQYVSMGEYIASRGMAAVTFNHRMLMTGSSVQDILDDISVLRGFIGSKAVEFSIDVSRTCIWAISAGLPFGVYNALNYRPDDVKCVVCYYGFGDFMTLADVIPGLEKESFGISELIPGPIGSPIMIVRAGLDYKIINDSLDRFILKCFEVNAEVEVYNHNTGRHAFDILDDNSRSHDLMEKTMLFLEKHLLPG